MNQEAKDIIEDFLIDYMGTKVFFNDDGFVSYRISEEDKIVYVANYFVPRAIRNTRKGVSLMRDFMAYMNEIRPDIHTLFGDVQIAIPGGLRRLELFSKMGAELFCSDGKAIAVKYDLTKGPFIIK